MTPQNSMTHLTKDINAYYLKALESIPSNHPHKEEIKKLLLDQVYDDANTFSN